MILLHLLVEELTRQTLISKESSLYFVGDELVTIAAGKLFFQTDKVLLFGNYVMGDLKIVCS